MFASNLGVGFFGANARADLAAKISKDKQRYGRDCKDKVEISKIHCVDAVVQLRCASYESAASGLKRQIVFRNGKRNLHLQGGSFPEGCCEMDLKLHFGSSAHVIPGYAWDIPLWRFISSGIWEWDMQVA